MKKGFKKRLFALALSASLLAGMPGISASAATEEGEATVTAAEAGLCEHHTEHTPECGYVQGQACGHVHTEECYRIAEECVHTHTEECYPESAAGDTEEDSTGEESEGETPREEDMLPENCSHVCSEESGCIVRTLECQHEHDDSCGYVEEVPCSYQCGICSGQEPDQPEPALEEEHAVVSLQESEMLAAGSVTREEALDLSSISSQENTAEGWKWEKTDDGGTLTLNNCHILTEDCGRMLIFPSGTINIVLEGENILESTSMSYHPMIYNAGADWIIQGEGSLELRAGGEPPSNGMPYGFTGSTITIKSGNIVSNVGFCMILNEFAMEGGSLNVNVSDDSSDGIYSDCGPVNLKGGTVNIDAGRVGIYVPGMGATQIFWQVWSRIELGKSVFAVL